MMKDEDIPLYANVNEWVPIHFHFLCNFLGGIIRWLNKIGRWIEFWILKRGKQMK